LLPYAPWLCWLIPFLGTAITPLLGVIRQRLCGYFAALSIGLSALLSLSMIPDILTGYIADLRAPSPFHDIGVLIDPLSVLMACVITCIGLLVALFSVSYMQEEAALARFWFLIQLFIGGYLVIVIADNLLFVFIGWEIVGLCCTGLAAFWHKDPQRAHVGLRTFLILRVADVLLLASILLIYVYSSPQTLNITDLAENNNIMGELSKSGFLFVTALMFFGGAVGKSAQFPLQEWLPDALAASPSCFNALTECLAGPFLVARVLPIFHGASLMNLNGITDFFLVMAFLGAFTSVVSALIAMAQINIFKVLAYSISSVIGYMMTAFGLAGLMNDIRWGYLAGTFLLTVDAFVSALLFLTAAYIFYVVGADDMHHMGGFKSGIAHRSMEVGLLALAGIPPLSGFWCTNWIQTVALDFAAEAGLRGQFMLMISGYLIFALLIIASGITAFYALRIMGLIFGKKSHELKPESINEAPSLMRDSLVATLVVTVFLDFLALFLIWPFNVFLLPLPFQRQLAFKNLTEVLVYIVPSISTVLTCVAVAIGGYPAYKIYMSNKIDADSLLEKHAFLRAIHKVLWNRLYISTFYDKVAYSIQALSKKMLRNLESNLDALNSFTASHILALAKKTHKYVETEGITKPGIKGFSSFYETLSAKAIAFSQWAYPHLELGGFEKFNHKLAKTVAYFSNKMRKTQTGILSYNMLTIPVGIALMIILITKLGTMS